MDKASHRWRGNARLIIVYLVLGLINTGPADAEAMPNDAKRFLEDVMARGTALLSAPSDDVDAKAEAFRQLLAEAVDLEAIGRFVLGRHAAGLTPAEWQDYTSAFADYVLNSSFGRLAGETVSDYRITTAKPAGTIDTLVTTVIHRPGEETVEVTWRVRVRDAGHAIVDVIVAGVSLAITHRSEFAAILDREGIAGLIGAMRRKVPPSSQN